MPSARPDVERQEFTISPAHASTSQRRRKFPIVDLSRMFVVRKQVVPTRLAEHVNQWRQNTCPSRPKPLARCVTQGQQVVPRKKKTRIPSHKCLSIHAKATRNREQNLYQRGYCKDFFVNSDGKLEQPQPPPCQHDECDASSCHGGHEKQTSFSRIIILIAEPRAGDNATRSTADVPNGSPRYRKCRNNK